MEQADLLTGNPVIAPSGMGLFYDADLFPGPGGKSLFVGAGLASEAHLARLNAKRAGTGVRGEGNWAAGRPAWKRNPAGRVLVGPGTGGGLRPDEQGDQGRVLKASLPK